MRLTNPLSHMSYRQPSQNLGNDSQDLLLICTQNAGSGDYRCVRSHEAGVPVRRWRWGHGSRPEEGASLVEFALLAPLLILLLFGIIEFGWLFAQNLDVRHGAREGARLAAVNFPEGPEPNSGVRSDANRDALVAEICARMQTPTGADVTITSAGAVGDSATVVVTTIGDSLTGLISTPITLDSTVQIRLEQAATWTDTAGAQPCP